MSNPTVYVVYSDGPGGMVYPYGVFTTRSAAREAREAIIKKLDNGVQDTLDDEMQTLTHEMLGTLDETTRIQECELRAEFTQDDLDELFANVDND